MYVYNICIRTRVATVLGFRTYTYESLKGLIVLYLCILEYPVPFARTHYQSLVMIAMSILEYFGSTLHASVIFISFQSPLSIHRFTDYSNIPKRIESTTCTILMKNVKIIRVLLLSIFYPGVLYKIICEYILEYFLEHLCISQCS